MAVTPEQFIPSLDATQKFFEKSVSALEEADSGFAPAEGMMTAAAQVAHVAITVDWFIEGTFTAKKWDLDFEKHMGEAMAVKSLKEALAKFRASMDRAREVVRQQTPESLEERFPADDPILPNQQRTYFFECVADHTAHHRGALTVYARLLGKVAPVPYM